MKYLKTFENYSLNEEESWKEIALAGAMATSMGAAANTNQQADDFVDTQISQSTKDNVSDVVSKGGIELGQKLIDAYNKNPKAAEQWQSKHKNTSIVDVIKSVISVDYKNKAKGTQYEDNDIIDLGNQYKGNKQAVDFIKVVGSNAFSM